MLQVQNEEKPVPEGWHDHFNEVLELHSEIRSALMMGDLKRAMTSAFTDPSPLLDTAQKF